MTDDVSDARLRVVRADHVRCHSGPNPGSMTESWTPAEIEFMTALDRYKRLNRIPFPCCSEVLAVLESMGYVRTGGPPAPQRVAPNRKRRARDRGVKLRRRPSPTPA